MWSIPSPGLEAIFCHARRRPTFWGGDTVIQVYDSLTRQMAPFKPHIPGHVSIYTCGVTPYDHSHIGHARPAVVWDVIRRHLRRRGYVVTFVQNFTDIDDKIIRRAEELGRPVDDLATEYMAEYHQILDHLGVMPPDYAPRVTENIGPIVEYIEALIQKGKAYAARGDVYFRVKSDPEYGRLSGRKLEDMLEGVRVEVEPGKEYPGDFALWKSAGAGEPAWPSPWGPGRPGWHIECSAMSMRYLGAHFDMHGGGMDLIFPHHENERAQSRAYLEDEAVTLWVHSGLITRGDVKMSKSLKNGVTLGELLDQFPPHVLRTYLLSVHYRSPLDFDERYIQDWSRALSRIDRLWQDVREAPPARDVADGDWAETLVGFEEQFLAALDDDFNTARAFAIVFDMVNAAHRGIDQGNGEMARGLARRNLAVADDILGFLPEQPGTGAMDEALLQSVVSARDGARRERNWAFSDALRTILTDAGYEVLDGADGTRVHRRSLHDTN